MKYTKTDRIIFRLPEYDGERFRQLSERDGGPSAVLRRYIRRYIRRLTRKSAA